MWHDETMGADYSVEEIPANLVDEANEWREKMLEKVAEFDDALMEKFFDDPSTITEEEILRALRAGTLKMDIVPMFCGSSFKNKGVQTLLDYVCAFLPSPLDTPAIVGTNPSTGAEEDRKPSEDEKTSALAFKIATDPYVGRLTFFRVYSGKIEAGSYIYNTCLLYTSFNADFDGDQMAVHLPLSNDAILEAQMLMLQAHNILNPANGAPITVPAQDMVLGLYYITKLRKGAKGEGLTFYGPEEALIAYNEGKVDIHAIVNVVVKDLDKDGKIVDVMMKETSVGRVIVNEIVPAEVGYLNTIISKKSLRDIISDVIKAVGVARACEFLDGIKNLGYYMAFKGGLSFNLGDIIIPKEKEELVKRGNEEVEQIMMNYNMGFITDNERYNQVIDTWTHVNSDLSDILYKTIKNDDQGFNSVFMMLDSGARGSKEQIRQLSGMRGLMAKPQKAGAEGAQIIENPILSNFKEGL